ncbi:oxidoreductase [Alkalimarinus coralli]|uniref:oxidoreductase n=1 Tax=Alkalimarinus coralli TaxID=2935863 RepID=UPI00202B2E23|nr:oxidoreductase [Alkalimarinus coralli]
MKWTTNDIPNLNGKVAIVTGANGGLGLVAAKALASKGCHVVMACRSIEKANAAADEIRQQHPTASVEIITLDLSSLESIKQFSDQIHKRFQAIDILCNNAGVMDIPYRKTTDGFEMQFGTNHLGHFALTGHLLDLIAHTEGARIVTTSSLMHIPGKINFNDLHSEEGYSGWKAYFQSKLANLLFTFELQRKLKNAGAKAISVASHPGYASTNLQLVGAQMGGASMQEKVWKTMNNCVAQSAEMGTLPTLYAATHPNIQGGDYIGPNVMGWRGYPKKVGASKRAKDADLAAKLWSVSENLTGVAFAI